MAETTDNTSHHTQNLNLRRLTGAGLVAAVVAAVGNIIVLMITEALFTIPASFEPFNMTPIALFSVVGVVGATVVFGLLVRYTQRPVRWFWIVSVVVLLLSFIPNIALLVTDAMSGTTVAGVIALMIMHVVAAAAAVGFLTRTASDQQ